MATLLQQAQKTTTYNNKLHKPVIAFFSKSCDIIIYICCCETYVDMYTIYIYIYI